MFYRLDANQGHFLSDKLFQAKNKLQGLFPTLRLYPQKRSSYH